MFSRIIEFATNRPKRVIALWAVLAIALSFLGAFKGYEVTTDDTAQFLPKGSESAQATEFAQDAFGREEGTSTVTVVLKRSDGRALTDTDHAEIATLAATMPRWRADASALNKTAGPGGHAAERAGRILAAAPGPVAPHGRFALVGLEWKANATDPVAQEAFRQFREHIVDQARSGGLRVGFTGGVASTADRTKADEGRRIIEQALLFGAIIMFSLLFFRAPLAAFVPLLTIYLVAGAASGLVVLAALAFGFKLDVSTPQLITVVLVGVGVDYFLFLVFRLRERLRAGEDRRTAARSAALRVSPVIAAAALAVVAAFATLGLAQFGQFRVLGPAIAISVLVMLLAGVTLMPAVAAITGRALFWPSKSWARQRPDGPAARLGRRIAHRPARTALGVTAVLVALATAALGATMSYDLNSSGPSTPATRAADQVAAAMPEGASDPQHVYVQSHRTLTAAELEPLRESLETVDGVGGAATPILTPDRKGAQIDLALEAASTSKAAMDLAGGPLRDAAHNATPKGTIALVGGTAAVFADVSDSVDHDLRLIFPVAAGLILLILVFTLRSALAPLYLLAAVALEFAATLGAAVLVFQVLGGATGIAFTMPLVLFLFVVALGTDYNILMTARLREEMLAGKSARQAVAESVRHVAPAVGAAGLVLSSSFGSLMLASDQASREMGFAMALGILIASLIVSSVLIPAITALAGRNAWWPGRAARDRRALTAPRSTERKALKAA